MPAALSSPDQAHTRLQRPEPVCPPNHNEYALKDKRLFVPQQVAAAVNKGGRESIAFVTKCRSEREQEAQRNRQPEVGGAHVLAADDIATAAEKSQGYEQKPPQAEILTAQGAYLAARGEKLVQMAVGQGGSPERGAVVREQLRQLLQEGELSSTLYHLARLQKLVDEVAAVVEKQADPQTRVLGAGGEAAMGKYIRLSAALVAAERQLVVAQLTRRTARAEAQKKQESAARETYDLVTEVLYDPRQFAVRMQANRQTLSPAQIAELEGAFAKRYGDFFAAARANRLSLNAQGALEGDKKWRAISLEKESLLHLTPGDRHGRAKDALAYFCADHGIPLDRATHAPQVSPGELNIIALANLRELEVARLAAYERHDKQHALEIAQAKAIYLEQNKKDSGEWAALARDKGWEP